MAVLECDLLKASSQLASWETDWWRLWSRDPQATPFQSPAWLIPWSSEFAAERVRFCMVRRDKRLLGVLPMCVASLGSPALMLAGAGVSDYLDGVFHPEFANPVLAAAFRSLRAFDSGISSIEMTDLRKESPLLQCRLDEWTQSGVAEAYSACPGIPLDPVVPLGQQIPTNIRREVEYQRRRIARDFRPNSLTNATAPAEVLFDYLADLQARRWAGRDREWLLSAPTVRDFHRTAFGRFAERGLARIEVLMLDDEPASAIYTLLAHQTCYYYVGGFDERYAKYSIGNLMIASAMEAALQRSCTRFDFLRGREPYKYKWGAQDTPTFRRDMLRSGEDS